MPPTHRLPRPYAEGLSACAFTPMTSGGPPGQAWTSWVPAAFFNSPYPLRLLPPSTVPLAALPSRPLPAPLHPPALDVNRQSCHTPCSPLPLLHAATDGPSENPWLQGTVSSSLP